MPLLGMEQRNINVIAVSALGLLALSAAWTLLLEPTACPVPKGLLSQDGAAPCFEFWLARYQTMLAALFAVGGVYYATRPMLRQVWLMEQQRLVETRAQLKERYKAMTRLQQLLSIQAWHEQEGAPIPNPSQAAEFEARCGADEKQQRAALGAALAGYNNRIESLIAELRAQPLDDQEREVIEQAILSFRKIISDSFAGIRADNGQYSDWTDGVQNLSAVWFYCVGQPSGNIPGAMRLLSNRLEELKAATVAKM